jgi:tetratricopeptide (TPR) repeat protein
MDNGLKLFSLLTFTVGIFFLSGCGSSVKSTGRARDTSRDDLVVEIMHDRALVHYIEGAALDAKGLYADAILEYQEALKAGPNAAIYYAISRDYAIRGNYDRAVEQGREAVSLDPDKVQYRENLANIYFSASRTDLAIHEYEEIVKKDSAYTTGWLALANLYQSTQPRKALRIYEKLLDREPDQMDILFQCAQIYLSLGEFNEAAVKLNAMLESDPGNRLLQKQLADTYLKAGKFGQAQSILERIVNEDSSDFEAQTALADVYLNEKKYKKSINIYENLLKLDVENAELKLRIGAGLFGLSEQDSTLAPKAQSILEECRREIPNDWRPYWYLGAIALNQHKDSIAGDYFNEVVKLDGSNANAWWYLGSSLFGRAKYDSVLTVVGISQKTFPDDFRFYMLEGVTLNQMNKQAEAVAPLEKAYKLNPKDVNTISALALILDGLHRFDESDRLYEEGIKLDSTSALMLNNYGYSLAERGLQLERALEMARQAVKMEPENAAYLDTYGWIYFKLGKFEDAEKYVAKSVSTGKASAVVFEHLGDIYEKLGQKENAREIWKKALEMDPNNEGIKSKIKNGIN